VPGDNLAVVIDQDRDIKAEGLDALGDLPDLLLAVTPRVSRISVLVGRRPDRRIDIRGAWSAASRRRSSFIIAVSFLRLE
jgi:hypothetical protein